MPSTTGGQAIPVPIAWGTVKVPIFLIEKVQPTATQPPNWSAVTNFPKDQIISANGNAYTATSGGTSGGIGSAPSGTGTGIVDGTVVWDYKQQLPLQLYAQKFVGGMCEGEITAPLTLFWDKEKITAAVAAYPFRMIQVLTGPDAANQSVAASLFDTCGYQHTALVFTGILGAFTGTQKELPAIALEIKAVMLGSATPDISPADIVNDLLTHARRGVGWPGSRVGSSITGTAAGAYRVYCDAIGARFSLVLDAQRYALDILSDILAATNSDAVWSQGALKFVPLGDTAIASPVYGATGYVPTNTAQFNLGADDFLDRDNPVEWISRNDASRFNSMPVEYIDRAQNYVRTPVEDPDQADIEERGGDVVRGSTTSLPMVFPTGSYPVMLSRILTQRSLNIVNTYTFRLPWKYVLLEPTDVVTLTDSISGLNLTPVRITQIDEGSDFSLTVTAEDYPQGVAAAASYSPQASDGYVSNDAATSSIIPSSIDNVRIGIAQGITTIGNYVIDEVQSAVLQGVGRQVSGSGPTLSVDRVWYRGNNRPGVNAGAPNLGCVFIQGSGTQDTTLSYFRMLVHIQPTGPSDNLDGLRYLFCNIYRQPNNTGAATTLQLAEQDIYIPVADRLYRHVTDSDVSNRSLVAWHSHSSVWGSVGFLAVMVKLVGVNGESDFHCYYTGIGVGATGFLTDNGNSFPGWLSGGGAGGSGSGTSGGGGCLDPETPILIGRDMVTPLRALRAGDQVWTMPERGGEFGFHRVESVRHTRNVRCRISFRDGRSFICSVNHLLNVRGVWRRADSLTIGEELQGDPGGHVAAVDYLGEGPVVQLSIPTARTYVAGNGCWHHNTYKP